MLIVTYLGFFLVIALISNSTSSPNFKFNSRTSLAGSRIAKLLPQRTTFKPPSIGTLWLSIIPRS